MKEKNESLFNDTKKLEDLFKEAVKNCKPNPDLNLPPSSYLTDKKILKKTKHN